MLSKIKKYLKYCKEIKKLLFLRHQNSLFYL
jgi:hypothetical protein